MIPSLQGSFTHDDSTHLCESDVCHHKNHEGSHAEAMEMDHGQDYHATMMTQHADSIIHSATFACNCQKGQESDMILSLKYQMSSFVSARQYPKEEPPLGDYRGLKSDPYPGNIFRPPIILS